MMNRPIEGIVKSARLKHAAFGEHVFTDVVIRLRDGSEREIGKVSAASDLADVLTPGREGCFYFHDVMGAQGLHAYRACGEAEHVAFPKRIERMFFIVALLNLGMVSVYLSGEWGLPLVPLTLGVMATCAWAFMRGSREAVLHDLRYESRMAARSHRRAVMNGYA